MTKRRITGGSRTFTVDGNNMHIGTLCNIVRAETNRIGLSLDDKKGFRSTKGCF
jgi:hypothetical protein